MSHEHPYGRSKSVLKFSQDNKVLVEINPLEKMLGHPEVRNRKIISFSIIGAYRKGKSFFLDYCLRFLYANYKSINYLDNPILNPDGWMGLEDEPLQGYSWRSGSNRDTMGILVWNDVFLHTDEKTGEKFAIVVIDTQGLFDNETTPMDNSRIFALGTLISSIQVLNLSGVVQEDQLQYLQFATEFAKFAFKNSQSNEEKSFQNLMFLIRDWQSPTDHPFGIEGGKDYLGKMLEVKSNQKKELKNVREFINNSFEELSCALLPNPGKTVTGAKMSLGGVYNGNWGDMDEDFREELFKVVPYLLNPERLVIKKVNGINITGAQFLEYIVKYFNVFQSDKLPQARAIYELTVDTHLTAILNSCVEKYKYLIYEKPDMIEKLEEIPLIHEASRNEVLLMYKDSQKMGNAEHDAHFRKMLEDQINKIYKEWKEQTEANIRKVENEKKKTRVALEEKQKLALENLEHEKQALKHTFELEKMKQEFALQTLTFTKDKEIDKVKYEAEQKRLADERQHDMEKFKLEKEKDREESMRKHETMRLKQEGEKNEALLKANIDIEKIKGDASINTEKMLRQLEIAELDKKMNEERLMNEKTLENQRVQNEVEIKQKLYEADVSHKMDQLEIQNQMKNEKCLLQKEIEKAKQNAEEESLKNILLNQNYEETKRTLEEVKNEKQRLSEEDKKGLIRKAWNFIF